MPHTPATAASHAPLRSLLFVPADSPRKLDKAAASGADALILDLEDSVAADRKATARQLALEYLHQHPKAQRRQPLWVRINPLDSPWAMQDLCVCAGAPDGIMLPKASAVADVLRLGHGLDALEAHHALPAHGIRILPIVTEVPQALFTLQAYHQQPHARLHGLTWGAEDLAAAIGASHNRLPDGRYDDLFRLARSLCLAAASAAGVQPVDTIWADYRDSTGLQAEAQTARRAGFTGKLAIHPAQVPIINAAFTPDAAEIAWFERVVQAFADQPDQGTIGLDGKMLDLPHLRQAQRVLALAAQLARREQA